MKHFQVVLVISQQKRGDVWWKRWRDHSRYNKKGEMYDGRGGGTTPDRFHCHNNKKLINNDILYLVDII